MLCTWCRPEVASKTRAGSLRNINIMWNWSKSPNQTMDKGKRQRSRNFSDFERTLLKQIVSNHPIIENKQHDSATENKKKNAWTSICNEFNWNEKVSNRTLQQLQILWKNIKINLKKTNAVARRERFKTGGGPPERPETDDLGDLLTSNIDSSSPWKVSLMMIIWTVQMGPRSNHHLMITRAWRS